MTSSKKKKQQKPVVSDATKQLMEAQEAVKEEKGAILKERIVQKLHDASEQTGETIDNITFQTLLDIVAEVLKDGKITQADYEPVVQLVEELFEEYVRDFDIPGVPPLLEKFVDDMLKSMIRPLVRQLFNQFAAA